MMTALYEKLGGYLCYIVERKKCNKKNKADFADLLNEGADINFKRSCDDDNTPLHVAINKDDSHWIRFLIEKGANPTIANKHGISANVAALTKSSKVLEALNRFKKINKNYLTVIDNIVAINENFLKEACEAKILKIQCCKSFEDIKSLLRLDTFLKILQSSDLFVLIFELSDVETDNHILKMLSKNCRHPKILQFYSANNSVLYFNELNGSLKKLAIDNNLSLDSIRSQISNEELFNFEIVCNLLNLKDRCFGQFSGNLMEMEIDVHRKIDNFTLVDLAVARNDLLSVKFLSLFDLNVFQVNTDLVKKAINYGGLEDVKLTLRFSFFNNLLDENFLMSAVQSQKIDIVRFLVENNCNVNELNDFGANVSDCALENELFEILLLLLLADSPFPKDIERVLKSKSDNEKSGFQEIIDSRIQLHKDIEDNEIDKIKQFIKNNADIKHAYSKDNQCALTTALIAKSFEIYSILRSEGFTAGIDKLKCTQTMRALNNYEKEAVKKYNRKYFECSDSNHLQELLARSHLAFGSTQKRFEKIREYFLELNKISEVQPILKVVANSSKLKITFDFNKDSVIDMDPTQISDHVVVRGRTIYTAGNILIGAKQSEDKVLATLAHEMTHLAVHILYNNNGRPYRLEDCDQMEKFRSVVDTTSDNQSESHTIADAFNYSEADVHSELIVRVPQICVMLKNKPEKLEILRDSFKELFQYFSEIILKDCETNFPVMKSQQKIEFLNKLLKVYSIYESYEYFSDAHEKCNDDIFGQKSNLLVKNNYPELFIASIIKSQKNSMNLVRSHLFIEVYQLLDDKYFELIEEAFHSEMEPKVFVLCKDYEDNRKKQKALLDDTNRVLTNLEINCRVVLISSSIFEFSKKNERNIAVEYNWDSLCIESKTKFLKKEIHFQGKNVALQEMAFKTDFFAELSIKDIVKLKNWTVRQKLKNKPDFYIERRFARKDTNREITLSAEVVLDQMYDEKTIILADLPGKGKSCAVIDFAEKFESSVQTFWVLLIDLKDYTNCFQKDDERQLAYDYKVLITDILGESNIRTKLFFHLYDTQKVIFLIDGYDEISPVYSNFVLDFIKAVSKSGNLLLVATRTHCLEILEKELKVNPIHLLPFDEVDQGQFLEKFWSNERSHKNENKNSKKRSVKAQKLLKKFQISLGANSLDFFGNPLLIRMLAEIFSDQNSNQPREVSLNMFSLYEQFYEMKIDVLYNKGPLARSDLIKGFSKTGVLRIHHKFAIEAYFSDALTYGLDFFDLPLSLNRMSELVGRIGLLNVSINAENFTIEWMHRSFLEYFVADSILDIITEGSLFIESEYHAFILQIWFSQMLDDVQAVEVRKFANDKLNRQKTLLSRQFGKSLFDFENIFLQHLLKEDCTSLFIFIMEALTMSDAFEVLIFPSNMGDIPICIACSLQNNFTKWWPFIEMFLDKNYQKQLLLHWNMISYSLIFTVSVCANEIDFKSLVNVVKTLFSTDELKKILTGQYFGAGKLLFHSALKYNNLDLILEFWEELIEFRFLNVDDQKDILLATGGTNQRILCEGICLGSIVGITFLLEKMTQLFSNQEIMICLIHDRNKNTRITCLLLIAAWRSLETFDIVWSFIEATLNRDQKIIIFLQKTADHHNILSICLTNKDVRVVERVIDIATNLLLPEDLQDFLRIEKTRGYNLLHNSTIHFKQFKVLCKAFQQNFSNEELKFFLSEESDSQKNVLFTALRMGNPKNLNFLVKLSQTSFRGDEILSLFGGDKIITSLAILQSCDGKIENDRFLEVLNTTDPINELDKRLPSLLQSSDKVFHIILNFGSIELISKTICLMQIKLLKHQRKKLLTEKDALGYNALGRSLMNINKSAVGHLWLLYEQEFSHDGIKKVLLSDSVLTANIFQFAAITDHPFLMTALWNFLNSNCSQNELKVVFESKNCSNLTYDVAKWCSIENMTQYVEFIMKALSGEYFKLLILERMQNGKNIMFFLLENESVTCFRRFWSIISGILNMKERKTIILDDFKNIHTPINLFAEETNFESLKELKNIVSELFGEENLDESFEYHDITSPDLFFMRFKDIILGESSVDY